MNQLRLRLRLLVHSILLVLVAATLRTRHLQEDGAPIVPFAVRINAGSTEDFVDADGMVWKSDTAYTNTGDMYGKCPLDIFNTTLDGLYCKERYFNQWVHTVKPYKYTIPVPQTGAYTVKLHFAEIHYQAANERVFDVWVNGKLAIKSLDIYNEVGYATALVVPITTRVTTAGAPVSIEFVSKTENPKICAVEVIEILNYIAPPTAAPVVPLFTKHITRVLFGRRINISVTKVPFIPFVRLRSMVPTWILCTVKIVTSTNGNSPVHTDTMSQFQKTALITPSNYILPNFIIKSPERVSLMYW